MVAMIQRGELPSWINGYCYGDGYGGGDDGYGYSDFNGSGGGCGSSEYWLACVPYFASKWSDGQRQRLTELQAVGATIAYWRSDASGRACNGGKNNPVSPGLIEIAPGPLELCSRGTLHATLIPPRWRGERWWIVALTGEVIGDAEKFGALTREIIGEAL